MELRPGRALRRLAARRPHALVVAAPGAPRTRLAVETALASRRWPVATSPADADVLVVVGTPGPRLARLADTVWGTVPAPRARVRVRTPGDVRQALDAAAARLADGDSGSRSDPPPGDEPPMADLADDDRDGLALDALHVPLGPVLPGWPPGLVVHAVLAGDVITAASAEVLDARPGAPARGDGLPPDDARLDTLARVLDLAGATRLARRARALRDADPAGTTSAARSSSTAADDGAADLVRFGRRVARARVLARVLRDVPLPGDDATVAGRVRRWAGELGTGAHRDPRPGAAEAARSLVGLELGAARLALAALDPDTSGGPVMGEPATLTPGSRAAARG